MQIDSEFRLKEVVWNVVHRTPVFDIHTHLFDARFGDQLLWGIDELLTYHYLVAEVFRLQPAANAHACEQAGYDGFFGLDKREQANLVWNKVFLDNSPLGESARGVLTSLGMLGLDAGGRALEAHRAWFAERSVHQHIDTVFGAANVEAVVMTNDPLDAAEREVWERGDPGDPRFKGALRIDGLLNAEWKVAAGQLKPLGYALKARPDAAGFREASRFLHEWCDRVGALYMAVSLPPDFDAFDGSARAKLLAKSVLPVCRERGIPLALMIGVKKRVNEKLGLAGDGVGKADIGVVERLCAGNPDSKFLVTMLSRENQHELCVAARKFPNLMPFGCWWFLNDPLTIGEITRMRLELLGLSFIPQHSDARVLDQLLYKWAHSRWIIALALQDKYADLLRTGWRMSEQEIERDVYNLLAGNFRRFLGQ